MLLEQGVHLKASLKPKQAPNLALRQRSDPIGLDSKHFEGLPRHIPPSAFGFHGLQFKIAAPGFGLNDHWTQ